MNVLSLFDGMSCGRIALDKCGITPTHYFASEIDKHAIKVSKDNWSDITHIGDVTKISFSNGVLTTENGVFNTGKIDLVLAGSPCQGFSMAGKQLAFEDERSKLYFVFEKLLNDIKQENPDVKFLLENVKMKKEYKDFISSRLGVEPQVINSNSFSAQNRYRLYWTNLVIGEYEIKDVVLEGILQEGVEEAYYIKGGRLSWLKNFGEVKLQGGYIAFNPAKAKTLTVRAEPSWNCTYIVQWPHGCNAGDLKALDGKTPSITTSSWQANNYLVSEGLVRKLTPIECERLQTVPDNYTKCVSNSQRYKMLGNGWTVDVIAHILQSLKGEKC